MRTSVPRVVTGLLTLLLFLFSESAVGGLWTLACLTGVDNDPYPDICAVVDPSSKDEVRDERQKWLERNQHMLKDVRLACDARLRRAYDNDEARIKTAKEEITRRLELRKKELLSDSQTPSNCSAYAQALSKEGNRIDYTPELIKEIRDGVVQPVDWSK